MDHLAASGLEDAIFRIVEKGTPFLGICVGLQLLFEGSEETPGVKGLGIFKGRVRLIRTPYKIPHMGVERAYYNPAVTFTKGCQRENGLFRS